MASIDLLCGPSNPDLYNQEDPLPKFDKAMSEILFNEKCKSCKLIKHEPITCEQANDIFTEFSNERDRIDSFKALDMLWVLKTCTMCPHCGKIYEKSGGCNQMRCQECDEPFRFLSMSHSLQYFKLALSGVQDPEQFPANDRASPWTRYKLKDLEWFKSKENFQNFLRALHSQLRQFKKLRICVECNQVKLLDKIEMETEKVTGKKYAARKLWPEVDTSLHYVCNKCAPKCVECKDLLKIRWHKRCEDCHVGNIPMEPSSKQPMLTEDKPTINSSRISPKQSRYIYKRPNFECNSSFKLNRQLDEKRKDLSSRHHSSEKHKSIAISRAEQRALKAATLKLKAKNKSRSIAVKYS